MGAISGRSVGDAALLLAFMSFAERERLADEVHGRQPNLFHSVLALQSHGATRAQVEMMLTVLLVFFESMKSARGSWPVISVKVQARCLARIKQRAIGIHDRLSQRQRQAAGNCGAGNAEQPLLAYLYRKLEENGFFRDKTEVGLRLLLTALNLVECIVETAPREAA